MVEKVETVEKGWKLLKLLKRLKMVKYSCKTPEFLSFPASKFPSFQVSKFPNKKGSRRWAESERKGTSRGAEGDPAYFPAHYVQYDADLIKNEGQRCSTISKPNLLYLRPMSFH